MALLIASFPGGATVRARATRKVNIGTPLFLMPGGCGVETYTREFALRRSNTNPTYADCDQANMFGDKSRRAAVCLAHLQDAGSSALGDEYVFAPISSMPSDAPVKFVGRGKMNFRNFPFPHPSSSPSRGGVGED